MGKTGLLVGLNLPSEGRRTGAPALFIFLRIALAVLGLLLFYVHFRIIYSSTVKSAISNLIEITLNL